MAGGRIAQPSASATMSVRDMLTTTLWTVGSLAMLVVVMMWAYDLGSRDPDRIPALAAEDAPWRTQPAQGEEGGRLIPDQGASVFARFGDAASEDADALNSGGSRDRPTDADVAAARARAAAPSEAVMAMVRDKAATPEASERLSVVKPGIETPKRDAAASAPVSARLAPRPSQPPNVGPGVEPVAANAAAAPAEAANAEPPAAPTAASSGAIETGGETTAAAAAAAPAAEADAAVAGRRDPAGVYEVQLAALPSVAAVERRWAELRASAPTLLGAYELKRIRAVTRGDARLYRLRIGSFEKRADAARLCNQLRRQNIDCYAANR